MRGGGGGGARVVRWAVLAALALVVPSAAGCSGSPLPSEGALPTRTARAPSAPVLPDGVALAVPAVTAYVGPPRGRGVMPGVRPTRMSAALARAGLDVASLPPLESLAPGPKQRVMRTFSEALGLPCLGCHAEDDFKADTRRKRVARRMWNEFVRVVATRAGEPVYCDSCHDGALFHLDRRDPQIMAAYMCDVMVSQLRRTDGRTHDCTTCHGDPPDLQLLATWKETVAPDMTGDATLPRVVVPPWPIEGPREPSDCGAKGERCPLAAWMRLVVAPAASRLDDREALARALERVASFAPENDGFGRAARHAADVARRGDRASLRAACAACHVENKASWRATSRTRAAP